MEATLKGFAFEHFGAASLGDKRRTDRLVRVADRMINHPGGTLPQKMGTPADLKALYRLVDCDAVTHQAVLEPHRQLTLARLRECGEVIGLANQILHVRPKVPKREPRAKRQMRKDRETRLWKRGSQAVGPPPAGRRWVDVCDNHEP